MKTELLHEICRLMKNHLSPEQNRILEATLCQTFSQYNISVSSAPLTSNDQQYNAQLISLFIASKKIEGCSDNTLKYYTNTLTAMTNRVRKNVCRIDTNDLRLYLSDYQNTRHASKVTLDNIRRIMSSFFAWLEDEDYIVKSPVRRIHKVKATQTVKETLSDENLEQLRDQCTHPRDLAMIDLLISTGIRVGELVNLNRSDINFDQRECVVLGKGDKERPVYFDAKTKIHLQNYLSARTDSNPALFVSYNAPWNRLSIAGVERFLSNLGCKSHVYHVHPHKFRRTMATMAIEKGMPIEQVQKLLGHTKIDTTLHYAIVNQTNVKLAHKRYIS
ncbi:MAG: tyrosine-type recombinase/integrase [Lachnospiraceae bacterium]|nr:tyrosine-type recombinase/integrase [Lachnospiraceae bacterium]